MTVKTVSRQAYLTKRPTGRAESALFEGTGVTLTFDDESLRWVARCNHMAAAVEVVGGTLEVADAVESTDIGCSEKAHTQDDWLAEFFTGDPSWELDGDTLTLEGDATRMTFER